MRQEQVWCDGDLAPAAAVTVSAFDRTVQYGLGAFETLRLHGGRPFLVERHLERLAHSLAALELEAPACLAALPLGLVRLAAAEERKSAVARIVVSAGPGAADDLPGSAPRVVARLRPAPAPPVPPVVVGLASFAHDPRSPLAGVKSTSYVVHYLLRDRATREGRADDLMVDTSGLVSEGTISTLFVVAGGTLLTPPLGMGILAGVTRGLLRELAEAEGVPHEERPLWAADLPGVDEAFLTGAGRILLSIDVLAGTRLPVGRPVTTRLREALVRTIAARCGVEAMAVRF